MNLPEVVSEQDWQRAHEELLATEKAYMREGDKLAAERRRQPMHEIIKDYRFEAPDGDVRLLDLFEGRRQLALYHFMFGPSQDEGCDGCSMFVDQLTHLAHLHARDTTFVLVSPLEPVPSRHQDGEVFGFNVFIRDDTDGVYRTYSTNWRGVEAIGSVWSILDRTPLGRQEDWEDTPDGRPQGPKFDWWQLHDRYESAT